MATHHHQGTSGGMYFCTSTCWNWLSLIEEVRLYDHFYQWMADLRSKGCGVASYVLMPNHVHLLLFVPGGLSINSLLSNMKRFSAYEVIKRLKAAALDDLLAQLAEAVNPAASGSQHYRVWRISSDIKLCYSDWFIQQKLDYIHRNPVRGKWELAENASSYEHSSAAFYLHGKENKHVRLVHVDEVGFL
ncbi:MAG: transposase [Flavobacteriales bacterium]|nr:transposase [Flavobacteriales bacterium]